jgi:hypothetical protein
MGLVLFKDILKTVELANITKNQIDTYNAQSDPDPKIRLLANNRKICHDKLSKEKIKYIILLIILPIIVFIIIIYFSQAFQFIPYLVAWFVVGFFSIMFYFIPKWTIITTSINLNAIQPPNC